MQAGMHAWTDTPTDTAITHTPYLRSKQSMPIAKGIVSMACSYNSIKCTVAWPLDAGAGR